MKNTRHNAGFLLIDEICKKIFSFVSCEKEKFKSLISVYETKLKLKRKKLYCVNHKLL